MAVATTRTKEANQKHDVRRDFIGFGRFVRRRWAYLFIGCLVGLGAAAAYYKLATVKFESSAQILVMRKDPKLATSGADSTDQTEQAVSEDLLATHIQLLQSPEIVGVALRSGGFDQLPSIQELTDSETDAVDAVIKRLDVTRGGSGQSRLAHVLNISFRHADPQESKAILEAIVASYQKFLREKFQDVSTEAADLIARAKIELEQDLKQAEEAERKFREQAPLLWKGDESANAHRTRFEELQKGLSEIRLKIANADARLEVVQEAVKKHDGEETTDVQRLALLDHGDFERLNMLVSVEKGDADTAEFQAMQPLRLELAKAEYQSLMAMRMKEKSLLVDLGPDHPQIVDLRTQIKAADEFMNSKLASIGEVEKKPRLTAKAIIAAYRDLLEHDVATLTRQQVALLSESEKEQHAAKGLISHELKTKSLGNEVKRKQALYDAVIERLREINLVKDYGGFITEVIAPVENGKRVSPKLLLAILGGAVLGLMVGFGSAGAAELRDRTFHSVEALQAAIPVAILSSIPKIQPVHDAHLATAAAEAGLATTLQAFYRPKSREAEVFRGLRTSLFFAGRNGKMQVIACSSPSMGDGKSTVLANLAISIAQSGRQVLLVDCDLRRPTVKTLFQIDSDDGLIEVLSGEIEPADAAKTTAVPNLWVLPSGRIPPNPAELLASEEFQRFLELAREHYDFVLLDSPPVLAVADPCIVAGKADAVVLVVRLENNTRPQLLRTVDMLQEVGVDVAGIVVNAVNGQAGGGDDRYGYGYGYGSGSERNRKYFETEAEVAVKDDGE